MKIPSVGPPGRREDQAGTEQRRGFSKDHVGYAVLVVPMSLTGVGFSLALPPLTKAVVGSVATADLGIASGAFSSMRQLGGAFGVAILAVAFATIGSYTSAAAFSGGYTRAMLLAAGLALAGAIAATALPGRRRPARPRTSPRIEQAQPAAPPSSGHAA